MLGRERRGKSVYGYKKHIAINDNGMILGVTLQQLISMISKGIVPLIDKIPTSQLEQIMADKAPSINPLVN